MRGIDPTKTRDPEKFDPSIAFQGKEDLLPVCPCGCKSRRAGFYQIGRGMKAPSYLQEFFEKGERIGIEQWLDVEREIIRNQDWKEDPLFHWMTHLKLIAPWVTHDPNLVRTYREMLDCEDKGIRRISTIGHASSAKTTFIIVEAFQYLDLFPKNTEIFVGAPYKTSSGYNLWNQFKKYGYQRQSSNLRLPVVIKDNYISTHYEGRTTGPGTIQFISSDKASTIKGKKQDIHGDEGDKETQGRLIIALDEVSEFKNQEMVKAIANLRSQPNLRVRTSTNFDNFDGLIPDFYTPMVGSFETLSLHEDFKWMSVGNGKVLRFQAIRSPNLTLGHDYYPYLLGKKEHDDILSEGEDSKAYMSQGHAFPQGVDKAQRILVQEDLVNGQVFDTLHLSNREEFAFLDPAFTHTGDAAILYPMTYAYSTARDKWVIKPGKPHQIKISKNQRWSQEDVDLAQILRKGQSLRPTVKVGELMTGYDICAIGAASYLKRNNIKFNNFGYDESLDGKLGSDMQYFLGDGASPYSYGGKPDRRLAFPPVYKWTGSGHDRKKVRKRNDELHRKMVSQMWMSGAALIRNGHVCGMRGMNAHGENETMDLALEEALKRQKDKKSGVGGYEDIETKAAYKARNQNKSPDYADALFGGFLMITERRLQPEADVAQASTRGGISQIHMLMESGVQRKPLVESLSR